MAFCNRKLMRKFLLYCIEPSHRQPWRIGHFFYMIHINGCYVKGIKKRVLFFSDTKTAKRSMIYTLGNRGINQSFFTLLTCQAKGLLESHLVYSIVTLEVNSPPSRLFGDHVWARVCRDRRHLCGLRYYWTHWISVLELQTTTSPNLTLFWLSMSISTSKCLN